MIASLCKDPFRLFFPVAIFCLLYASGLWISFGIFHKGAFPIESHANLFLGGFLYFSILGFLLTAVPRFTKSHFLSKGELFFSAFLIVSVLFSFFNNNLLFFWLSIFLGWIFFIIFGLDRFLQRKENPPFTFVFVGAGVMIGMLGSFFLSLYQFENIVFAPLQTWGKIFFYDGMVTSFILGVGGRLIPGILGFTEIVKEQREVYEKPKPFLKLIPFDIFASLILFIASLMLRGFGYELISSVLIAIVITYFSIKYWRIHEKIKTGKWHGRMLKLSCWFIVIASWLICFFNEYAIHIRHLTYIGSYCLMTIMVASRVIVAHGSESLDLEHRKYPYLVVGLLIAFAALTRASAILMPASYLNHLGYAGIVLFVGVGIWAVFFFKRILIRKD